MRTTDHSQAPAPSRPQLLGGLARLSSWLGLVPASFPHTARTSHTAHTPARRRALLLANLARLEQAHALAEHELREEVDRFRRAFAERDRRGGADRTLARAWAVHHAQRALLGIDKAIARVRGELSDLADLPATQELRAVAGPRA